MPKGHNSQLKEMAKARPFKQYNKAVMDYNSKKSMGFSRPE